MTATARTPARGGTGTPGSTGTRAARRDAAPAQGRGSNPSHGRSPAVARAYARRAQRAKAPHGGTGSGEAGSGEVGRTSFVLLVMGLLGIALAATLWLSTAATADSYHLQSAYTAERNLTERSESLGREVATLETAPELARRARELGMVPAGDAARLVVRPDGGVVLIGQPRKAVAPAPPPVVPVLPLVPVAGPAQPSAPALGPLQPAPPQPVNPVSPVNPVPPVTTAPAAPASPAAIGPAANPSGHL